MRNFRLHSFLVLPLPLPPPKPLPPLPSRPMRTAASLEDVIDVAAGVAGVGVDDANVDDAGGDVIDGANVCCSSCLACTLS